ncbi:hypothetical protein AND_008794 [Anopheles darlingi]|uniref:Uncharacterized protein n=1 Tax=Anopheles darlingi TaxID=43151 RepID=W5J8B8_ANODA|nr:hypothetical protein AND_008794 [Anopheles darlingi]
MSAVANKSSTKVNTRGWNRECEKEQVASGGSRSTEQNTTLEKGGGQFPPDAHRPITSHRIGDRMDQENGSGREA